MVDLPEDVKNMAVTPPPAPAKPAEERTGEAPRGEYRGGGAGGGDRGRSRFGGGGSSSSSGPRSYGGPGGGRSGGPGGGGGSRDAGPGGPGGRRPFQRRRRLFGSGKVCQCCVRKMKSIDYKDLDQLRFFVSSQGKILPRRMSGTCARHQRMLTTAIKRARHLALLPFKA
jgi:small subunit ribosomal protein S18